jgi:hypothetical protein
MPYVQFEQEGFGLTTHKGFYLVHPRVRGGRGEIDPEAAFLGVEGDYLFYVSSDIEAGRGEMIWTA